MRDIVGFIGQITPNKVSGWAMDKNSPETPLILQLVVDGEPIAQTKAGHLRKDIHDKGLHPSGHCGFTFTFKNPVYDFFSIRVFVQETNIEIPWSGMLAQRERQKIGPSEDRYFFIHIPKTAGTSFRTMLYRQFDQRAIYPQFKDIKANSDFYNDWSNLSRLNREDLAKISLLTGHFPFSARQFVGGDRCQVITVLRDPIRRVYSLLAHLQRHQPQLADKSMEQIFLQEQGASNGITRLFINDFSKAELDRTDLEEAKDNLTSCALIGLSEYFEETVSLAEKKFGWKLGHVVTTNVGHKYQQNISPALTEQIRRGNELDIELYAFAEALFKEELKAVDS